MNKNSKTVLVIGGLIVFIIILILLNYFDIVNLKNGRFRLFPLNLKSASPVPASPATPNATQTTVIIAASLRNDYLLSLTDEKGLSTYFENFGIWGKAYNTKVQTDTLPVNKALIFLSDKKNQIADYKDAKGNILFSYSLLFKGDTIFITVFLPPETISSPNASSAFGQDVVNVLSKINSSNSNAIYTAPEGITTNRLFSIIKKTTVPIAAPSATPKP